MSSAALPFKRTPLFNAVVRCLYRHGANYPYAIARAIGFTDGGVRTVLLRLKYTGLASDYWDAGDTGQFRHMYQLTILGEESARQWGLHRV